MDFFFSRYQQKMFIVPVPRGDFLFCLFVFLLHIFVSKMFERMAEQLENSQVEMKGPEKQTKMA